MGKGIGMKRPRSAELRKRWERVVTDADSAIAIGPARHPERAKRVKGSLSRQGRKSLGQTAILSSLRDSG